MNVERKERTKKKKRGKRMPESTSVSRQLFFLFRPEGLAEASRYTNLLALQE